MRLITWLFGTRRPLKPVPLIHIPLNQLFNNPRAAYEKALKDNGPVIAVWRKARLEYIVDDSLSYEVLTNDKRFGFKEGTSEILNLRYLHHFAGTFWDDMDTTVKVLVSQVTHVVEKISPIFLDKMDAILKDGLPTKPLDLFDHAHATICEAMAVAVYGDHFVSSKNLHAMELMAMEVASVTGIYQNTSWMGRTFPTIWRIFMWLRTLYTIIFKFLPRIGPQTWKEINRELRTSNPGVDSKESKFMDFDSDSQITLVQYLLCKNMTRPTLLWRIKMLGWILTLIMGLLFASVHQTSAVAVWVVCELAKRPEYIPEIREECESLLTVDSGSKQQPVTYQAIQQATRLDSFIREVLRTKGDTLSTCRLALCDVDLGESVIPKGALVIPLASLSHFNAQYYGETVNTFDGRRWHSDDNSLAAVTGTRNYFPFGLGRWACPGRVLAVTEIKLIIWSFIRHASPSLEGGKYRILDPLNITSVPPEARIIFEPVH
ncbi:hypothetical protein M422DRAFT_249810 [Sphaerobolus stellatus SS14]|uniref:Cytochrome P450 n=1 Tax=Sphaerobolus stellatus (strain SS14) TaxID=990650 RepID=A0A0C9VUN1_SPHS4|nr:hypothetical protein M422DRAFT_249810 [Sphaerobolus stellatus SS14]